MASTARRGIEPLTARPPLAPGAKDTFVAAAAPCRNDVSATSGCSAMAEQRPSPARALVVEESEAVAVDRDEVLLIEDWRLRPDGAAIAPGNDAKDAAPLYTANGKASSDIRGRGQ